MRRIYLLLLILTACAPGSAAPASHVDRGNVITDDVPESSAELKQSLQGYLAAREAAPLGWTPKGELLIVTRFADVDQLHLVERPGGARRQLTFSREPVNRAAFSPDPQGRSLVYAEDGGDAKPQLFYQRLGAVAKRLTDGRSVNGGALWSNAGRELAFFTTARNGADTDIDVVEPETGALPRLVVTGDGASWLPLDWSPDDRRLLVLKRVSRGEGYLYVVDLSSGQKREIDAAPAKAGIAGARFSRDGQGVYFISDRDSEFARLRYVNLFTGDKSGVSAATGADVEELAISRDGHYLAYVSNEGGTDRLNLQDLRTHQDLNPPRLPDAGVLGSLCFDGEGKRLAFGLSSATRPRDAYVLELATNRLEAWTTSETGSADATRFVSPRPVQIPTFDRNEGRPRTLPAYLFEPAGAGPHPVLMLLHGGPDEQFRPVFDPWIQYAVNELGFAVVAPNVRGSSGYGKTYAALDNGTAREDVIKDLGALIVWLSLQTGLDAKHVVAAGAGYGGYLALAALVNYSDRLKGAVDLGGMSDFLSFMAALPPGRIDGARSEYGDERDPAMRAYLRRISPLNGADRILRPVLVVQGRKAADIAPSESDQMVNRLRSRGAEVWYLQARDESEGFVRLSDREAYYTAFAQFLSALK